MANAKEAQLDPDRFSLIIIGPPKSGKTHMLRDAPPGSVFMFDFDDSAKTTLRGCDIEYEVFKDAGYKMKAYPDQGLYDYGVGWSKFMARLGEVGRSIDEGKFPQTILVFDSLTSMVELAMNNVMKTDGKSGQAPQIQHWGALNRAISEAVASFVSWPLIKVMTAHVQREEDDYTKTVQMLPLLPGKLAGKVPSFYDEVYYTDYKDGKYTLSPDKSIIIKQAGSRFGIKGSFPNSWTELTKRIREAR